MKKYLLFIISVMLISGSAMGALCCDEGDVCCSERGSCCPKGAVCVESCGGEDMGRRPDRKMICGESENYCGYDYMCCDEGGTCCPEGSVCCLMEEEVNEWDISNRYVSVEGMKLFDTWEGTLYDYEIGGVEEVVMLMEEVVEVTGRRYEWIERVEGEKMRMMDMWTGKVYRCSCADGYWKEEG